MNYTSNNIPNQYQGFLLTPLLWNKETIFGLQQFYIQPQLNRAHRLNIPNNLMLGKRVERFVSHLLKQQKSIRILQENIQINHKQITIGELDCLLLNDDIPFHIEVVYKFYLYDDTIGNSELEHLIGPNRKDSLVKKLKKLSHKQLPLLHKPEVKPFLDRQGFSSKDFSQYVYFKAQIFLPLNQPDIVFLQLNNKCIIGFYAKLNELDNYHDSKFYIPQKIDWLVIPHLEVNWLDFDDFKTIAKIHLSKQKAPLCWMKKTNGELQKFFVVWW